MRSTNFTAIRYIVCSIAALVSTGAHAADSFDPNNRLLSMNIFLVNDAIVLSDLGGSAISTAIALTAESDLLLYTASWDLLHRSTRLSIQKPVSHAFSSNVLNKSKQCSESSISD